VALKLRLDKGVTRMGVPPAEETCWARVTRLAWYWTREMFAAAFWSLCPNWGMLF
jgi:hypothetical protein